MLVERVLSLPPQSLGKHKSYSSPNTQEVSASLLLSAQSNFEAGRLEDATSSCVQVLTNDPTNISALLLLIELAIQSDQLDRALEVAELTVIAAPECALAHLSLARVYQASYQEDLAQKSYLQALNIDPTLKIALCNLAESYFSSQNYQAAIEYGQQAVALDTSAFEAIYILGRCFFALGDFELSLEFLSKADGLRSSDPDIINSLARAHQRLRRSEEAIELYRRAIAMNSERASLWEGLGIAQRALGRFDDAAISFDKALKLEPGSHESYCALAVCRRAVDRQLLLEPLLSKLESPSLSAESQVSIRFALGKQFDDHGMYDDAFEHYAEGNLLFKDLAAKKGAVFDAEKFRSYVDDTISRFGTAFFETYKECGIATEVPVFIVGHPRSGTSLTEQILASHPSVHGAGELQQLGELSCRESKHWKKHGIVHQKALRREARLHLSYLQTAWGRRGSSS